MLGTDSPLIQLPLQLGRKQIIFLDGIRHAAEIMALAHSRLGGILTEIACLANEEEKPHHLFTAAYLDAWVIVDAIDRIRSLLLNMPGGKSLASPDFFTQIGPIRLLRNVADHVHQRVDHIIAQKSTALGTLSWFTLLNGSNTDGVLCVIVPGTAGTTMSPFVNPAGRTIHIPTGLITLTAGEHNACLSDMVRFTTDEIEKIEARLHEFMTAKGIRDQPAGGDMIVFANFQLLSPIQPLNVVKPGENIDVEVTVPSRSDE